MELGQAAAQYFDAGFWHIVGISLLVSAAAFLVMRLYTRAVTRESQRSASAVHPEAPSGPAAGAKSAPATPLEMHVETLADAAPLAPRSETFKYAVQAFSRAAWCYGVAGAVHAASSMALLFYFGFYSSPRTSSALTTAACYFGVFWAWLFTTIVALALFYGPDPRLRALLVAAYAAMLLLAGVVLELARAPNLPFSDIPMIGPELRELMLSFVRSTMGEAAASNPISFSPHTQPTLFFALSAMPVFLVVLGFNRFIRATVGPLFITVALLLALGQFVIADVLIWTVPRSTFTRLLGDSPYAAVMVSGLILAGALTCAVLVAVVRRYRQMKLSDQTFLFDVLWLSASVFVCFYLMGNEPRFSYLIGLLPFALYKLVLWYGFPRMVVSARALPNARLLFLRVFGSAKRSEKLFDLLAARWRYAGSVQLISGADIARSRFEPDEFLDFIAGRFKARYIENSADLAARLAHIEWRPDPDGRYRVHEFFCRADAWQETVTRLMQRSELVAMDLRGFTSERRGCIFELGVLVNNLPLDRVVLLVDRTSDVPLLRQTLAGLWAAMDPASPNRRAAAGHLRIIDLTRSYPRAVRRLMQIGDEVLVTGGFATRGDATRLAPAFA